MTDDLKDIDTEVVQAIEAHAEAFIDADLSVDEIIGWGENELKAREQEIKSANGSLADFKKAAAEVEDAVKIKLQALEVQVVENSSGR